MKKKKEEVLKEGLKLDLGCGTQKQPGFIGVDIVNFQGVDLVYDLSKAPWPWEDGSVKEVYSSHFIEHLTAEDRITFFNELYRILEVGGKATLRTPHWGSSRAYGDLDHKWPPVVEFFWYYLSREWRKQNAPHSKLDCNFNVSWGFIVSPEWEVRNQETQVFGINHYREVAQDMIATAIKEK